MLIRLALQPAWFAGLVLFFGCRPAELPVEEAEPEPASYLGVELVSTSVERASTFNQSSGVAVFRIANRSGRELAFWGRNGETPVPRLAVRGEDRWIGEAPGRCGLGMESGRLAAGATLEVPVSVPAIGPTYRVGFGCWVPSADAMPDLSSWLWTWSDPLDEELLSSERGGRADFEGPG